MRWNLSVFALVDTSMLQRWNAIAVPALWAFTHERSIGADRSGSKPTGYPTARRLSPLSVRRISQFSFLNSIQWYGLKTLMKH